MGKILKKFVVTLILSLISLLLHWMTIEIVLDHDVSKAVWMALYWFHFVLAQKGVDEALDE